MRNARILVLLAAIPMAHTFAAQTNVTNADPPATTTPPASDRPSLSGVCGLLGDTLADSLVLPLIVQEQMADIPNEPWYQQITGLEDLKFGSGFASESANAPDAILARVASLLAGAPDAAPGTQPARSKNTRTPASPIDVRFAEVHALLESLPPQIRAGARAQHLLGTLAFQEGRFAQAAVHFRHASELEPDRPIHSVNLLAARIQDPDPDTAARADAALAAFQNTPGVGPIVHANRLAYALRMSKDPAAIETFARHLIESVDPRTPSYILYLDFLRRLRPAELRPTLAKAFDDPALQPQTAIGWLQWLWHAGETNILDDLLAHPHPLLDRRPEIALFEAEIRRASGQTDRLRACLEKPAWESMRTARNTYRFWIDRLNPDARTSLANAIERSASEEPDSLLFSASLLESWGFPDNAAPLWILLAASDHPAAPLGKSRVTTLALRSGNTPLLHRLYETLAARPNADLDAQLKHTYLGLLLGEDLPQLLDTARRLHALQPDNPAIASVFAYATLLAGNQPLALQILASLNPESLPNHTESLLAALVFQSSNPPLAHSLASSSIPSLRLPEERVLLNSIISLSRIER